MIVFRKAVVGVHSFSVSEEQPSAFVRRGGLRRTRKGRTPKFGVYALACAFDSFPLIKLKLCRSVLVIGLTILLCCSALNIQSADMQKEMTVDLGDGVSFVMVRIEPGTFTIGSPSEEKDRREIENQQLIRISKPYYIGKFEVTQAVWKRVMTAKIANPRAKINTCGLYWGPGDTLDITCNAHPSKFVDSGKPVDSVSWRQCKEFIARLNLLIDGPAFRLPTEAEWEYAARAGTKTAYSFGNESAMLDDFAWYKKNSGKETHPCGTKKPNPWGLYDMYGNVWEWCEDKFTREPYPFSGKEEIADFCNRGGEGGTASQVIRGGSFTFSAGFCRSAVRSGGDPWHENFDIGLRLVRDAASTDISPASPGSR